jgi:HSP20 family molecular chaperone IbpA
MAFVLTPSFAPVYHTPQHNPFGFCAPVARRPYGYHVQRAQPRRPQYSPYSNFFSQVNDLLSEIDREAQRQAQLEAHREAQREAHRQRQQQRKRALRAKFDVNQNEQGWQVEGDIQGFDSDNISIEVTDEHTLKIAGNTQWQREVEPKLPQIEEKADSSSTPAVEQSTEQNVEAPHDEPEAETATETESTNPGVATPDSDTLSHKSYQATVEDDFEDLGAESSSLSSRPSTPVESTQPKEPKGKEKAVEEPQMTETALATQPQSDSVAHPTQEQHSEPQEPRVHGSFTRSFRFPSRIDVANVSASFKDGVLRVNVPRAQAPQTRRIAIQ